MNTGRLLLALSVVGCIALFEAGRLVARRHPASLWAQPLYWLGLLSAVATTILLVVPTVQHPTLIDVLISVVWLVVLWFLARVVQLHIRVVLAHRGAELLPWTAMLAPIGEPSDDGRVLLAGEWALRDGGAPLLMPDPATPHGSLVVGIIDRVWVEGGEWLMAAGRIVARAKVAGLMPEVSIMPRHRGPHGGEPGHMLAGWPMSFESGDDGQLRCVFPPGVVTAVQLGRSPAFAGVWLKVDRGTS